jgi:hypothetical protein
MRTVPHQRSSRCSGLRLDISAACASSTSLSAPSSPKVLKRFRDAGHHTLTRCPPAPSARPMQLVARCLSRRSVSPGPRWQATAASERRTGSTRRATPWQSVDGNSVIAGFVGPCPADVRIAHRSVCTHDCTRGDSVDNTCHPFTGGPASLGAPQGGARTRRRERPRFGHAVLGTAGSDRDRTRAGCHTVGNAAWSRRACRLPRGGVRGVAHVLGCLSSRTSWRSAWRVSFSCGRWLSFAPLRYASTVQIPCHLLPPLADLAAVTLGCPMAARVHALRGCWRCAGRARRPQYIIVWIISP